MRVTVLYSGAASPSVGWLAVDELAEMLAHYFSAELLSPTPVIKKGLSNLLSTGKRFHQIDSVGGDLLVVVARSPADLNMIGAIKNCRKKFQRIYGFVSDSYFSAGFGESTFLYDGILVTAKEDAVHVKGKYGKPVYHMYQGIDSLRWAPIGTKVRDIELISYGRTPPKYHADFVAKFHTPSSEYLYLHSPLGNLTGPTVRDERAMLFKILQRTRISLAFNLHVEATGGRPISMMVTSRWLESLLSGCIVAGKRPISTMADEMLDWVGSTIELSDCTKEAAEQLVDLLQRNDDLECQRRMNIKNIIAKHDWRYRIRDLCSIVSLSVPRQLDEDIWQLEQKSL